MNDAVVVELVTITVVVEVVEITDDEEFVDADVVVFDVDEVVESVGVVEFVVAKGAANAEDAPESDVIGVAKAGTSDIAEDDVSDVDIETEDETDVVEMEATDEVTDVADTEASDVEDSIDTVDIVEDVSDDVEPVDNSAVEAGEPDEVSDVVGMEDTDAGDVIDTVLSVDAAGVIEGAEDSTDIIEVVDISDVVASGDSDVVGAGSDVVGLCAWDVSESEMIGDGVDSGSEMLVGPVEVVGV